ncbi:hypothetical protein [Thalassospira alkalitolerans]|uniref:hypothetical protein n=1 Tax=Thalassospira alkalitolerans TaxID=1293890 RepID=UPI003AA85862
MSWVSIKMTEQEALGSSNAFIDAFDKLFLAAKSPKTAAIFCSRVMGPEDAYYLSPDAKTIAASLLPLRNPTPCPKPSKKDVILLAGHDEAIALLG